MKTTLLTLLEVVLQENELTDRSKLYLDTIASQLPMLETAFINYNRIAAASQTKHFVWLKFKPAENGRWLSREVDRFMPCANS